jgi:uncharacterized protein
MPKPPRYLKQLEHELLAPGDDSMLLEELDGFIAGLLICPKLIKPSEWLPVVWGSEGEDELAFDSLDHLNRVLGLVMEHYTDAARTLIERPDRYGPRFAVDKRHNERGRCPDSSRPPISTAATLASHLSSSTL